MNLEIQKKQFNDHVAKFTDLGNIKIVDFKNPSSSHYRIRFLFEEDYHKLHISGDLGELTATSGSMCYEEFEHIIACTSYFSEKIDCMSRRKYTYDEEQARFEIISYVNDNQLVEELCKDKLEYESEDEYISDILDNIMENFSYDRGISDIGCEILSEKLDLHEEVSEFGKESTDIIDLYCLAFQLANKQLKAYQRCEKCSNLYTCDNMGSHDECLNNNYSLFREKEEG